MKLSVFTDEINSSLPRALQLVKEWDLQYVEIRTVMGGRFPRLEDAELADLDSSMKEAGLAVSAVSPGYFKCLIDDAEVEAGISEGLPRACEWALKLGTSSVSSFAFRRSEGEMPTGQVVDYLGRMADVVNSAGCRMLLENEAACWGGTGLEAADIIRQVGPERIGLCWDPGNSTRAGGDPSAEFEHIRSFIEHVHLKNYEPAESRWSVLDRGVVDWPAIIALLGDIDYQGFLILETHTDISLHEFAPLEGQLDGKEENTLHNLKYLRELLDGS